MGSSWNKILYDHHTSLLHQSADGFSPYWNDHCIKIKSLFLNGDYNRVFDFLQFVLRHASVPTKFFRSVAVVLEKSMCAYTVVEDGPTIVAIALPDALLHNSGRVTDRSQSCLNAIEFALTQACPGLTYDSAPHI